MQNFYLVRTTNFTKYFTLIILLFSSTFLACKSSMEEDLAPVTAVKNTPAAVVNENTSGGSESTGGEDGSGESGEPSTSDETTTPTPTETQTNPTTPASPATPTAPATPTTPATPVTSDKSNVIANRTLKNSFPFPIGAAVDMDRLNGSTYNNVVSREFSSVTAESSMKFGAVHPSKDVFNFKKADAIVAFAKKNNMRVHGHTLIWPKDGVSPAWLLNFKGDSTAWDNLLKTHIQTVVKHFKGQVSSWDVVNEPYADNGTLKDNIWLRNIGPDYISKAFLYAHQADPNALLFLNDYGQEFGGKKMTAIMNLVANLRKCNIRIDGLGFQMHTVLRLDVKGLKTNVDKAVAAGLLIHFSELDVSVRYQKPQNFQLDDALATAQAAKFKEIVKVYLGIPKALQFGITTWGVSDGDSYMNSNVANKDYDYPLLFDKNYSAKPAYKSFIEAGLGK
jgi:endo-1,4-beta-xylanase